MTWRAGRLPRGTEGVVTTKSVPAEYFIRSATGLIEGRRLEKRGVAPSRKNPARLPG